MIEEILLLLLGGGLVIWNERRKAKKEERNYNENKQMRSQLNDLGRKKKIDNYVDNLSRDELTAGMQDDERDNTSANTMLKKWDY